MGVVWKERNRRVSYGCEGEMRKIRDKLIHVFGSLILGHDLMSLNRKGIYAVMMLEVDLLST